MPSAIKEIVIPLNDIRHLFLDPDCDPFVDRNLTISGLEYAIKQLRMKPLPEKIQLNLSLAKGAAVSDVANVKQALRRHCLNIVKEQEEESLYISWQIERNLKRALLPFLLLTIAISWIMYNVIDERTRFVQILLVLLNNCIIILGWVLLWIPAEMYLYQAPRIKREIAIYRLLADAEIRIVHETSSSFSTSLNE